MLLLVFESALQKHSFRLYCICLTANHIHLLLRPLAPKIPPNTETDAFIGLNSMPQCCSTSLQGVLGTSGAMGVASTPIAPEDH